MKHLTVLEAAGLVTTRKVGREKHHYLNPVPIRLVHDRWISKYAEPWVRGLVDLKHDLEVSKEADPRKPDVERTHGEGKTVAAKHVYEIYVRTTPEALWGRVDRP